MYASVKTGSKASTFVKKQPPHDVHGSILPLHNLLRFVGTDLGVFVRFTNVRRTLMITMRNSLSRLDGRRTRSIRLHVALHVESETIISCLSPSSSRLD